MHLRRAPPVEEDSPAPVDADQGERIICGHYNRRMPSDEYELQDCFPKRRSVYTLGSGAPGLGRRR